MTRMIERWFPCQEVTENSASGWGSGNSEKNLFTWFAARPLAQAKAAVLCSLLPWPEEAEEQHRLQVLVRRAMEDRDAGRDSVLEALRESYPSGYSVLDPFSGRGMIPLEAARMGSRSWGLDYSPVAVLAGKLLADYPARSWDREPELRPGGSVDGTLLQVTDTPRLLRDVEIILSDVNVEVRQRLAQYFPAVGGVQPWGYVWATTLPCQECGLRFPLTGSYVLRHPLPTRGDPGQSYVIEVDRSAGAWEAVVHSGAPALSPTLTKAPGVVGKSAICPFCEHVHALSVHRRMMAEGYGDDALVAVADLDEAVGKSFRSPTGEELDAIGQVGDALKEEAPFAPGLPAVPDERVPRGNGRFMTPLVYGATDFGKFCNDRQTLLFVTTARVIAGLWPRLLDLGVSHEYAAALSGYAASVMQRRLRLSTRGAPLKPRRPGSSNRVYVSDIFTNEASIAFSYDYFESGIGSGPGTWESLGRDTIATLRHQCARPAGNPATVSRGSALSLPFPDKSMSAVVTDPPYDEMVPYSDSSDLFFVWLKRALHSAHPELTVTSDQRGVQEKDEEIIVKRTTREEPNEHRTRAFYDEGIERAFAEAQRVVAEDGIVTIVFGHGDPEVWHRLLTAIRGAGLVLTGSWPARTESGGKAGYSNIETTLTLACRPAAESRPSGRVAEVDAEVQREIHNRVPLWESAGLALTDQLMASAGPAMEVVGRYSEVLDKTGSPVDLDRYLPLARRFVEEAADIKIDTLPLETFDARTRFGLFWVRLYGRSVTAGSEARWHRLAGDLTEEDTDGLVIKHERGVRLSYASEVVVTLSSESPVIDAAIAVAAAGRSVANVADVLLSAGRTEDPFVWAAMGELGRALPEADADGEIWTWVVRNRSAISGATRNVEAARASEEKRAEEAGLQGLLFGGDD